MQMETLVVPGKFLHLQHLCIGTFTPDYDYLSLVSLLDACPSLETFVLSVSLQSVVEVVHTPLAKLCAVLLSYIALIQVYVLSFHCCY